MVIVSCKHIVEFYSESKSYMAGIRSRRTSTLQGFWHHPSHHDWARQPQKTPTEGLVAYPLRNVSSGSSGSKGHRYTLCRERQACCLRSEGLKVLKLSPAGLLLPLLPTSTTDLNGLFAFASAP